GQIAGTPVVYFGSPIDSLGIFLWTDGNLISIARQGDSLPGGGHVSSASFRPGNYDVNDSGDVAFNAALDTGEQGVYQWSHGTLTLLAKTGTVIPGVGTIAGMDWFGEGLPSGGININDRGQVMFGATLAEGGGALLLATATGGGSSAITAAPI